MKQFEIPEIEIIELDAVDVVTDSWVPGEDEFPIG